MGNKKKHGKQKLSQKSQPSSIPNGKNVATATLSTPSTDNLTSQDKNSISISDSHSAQKVQTVFQSSSSVPSNAACQDNAEAQVQQALGAGTTGLDGPGRRLPQKSGPGESGDRGIWTVGPPKDAEPQGPAPPQDPGSAQRPSQGGGTAESAARARGSTQEAGLEGRAPPTSGAEAGGNGPQLPQPSERKQRKGRRGGAPERQQDAVPNAGPAGAPAVVEQHSASAEPASTAGNASAAGKKGDPASSQGKKKGRGSLPAQQAANDVVVDPATVIMPNFKRNEDLDAGSEEGKGPDSGASTSAGPVADAGQAPEPLVTVPTVPKNLPDCDLTTEDLDAMEATVNSEIGATKIVASNKKEFLKYEEAYSCLDRWLPRIYDGSARELSAKPSPEQRDRLLPLMRKILIGMCSNEEPDDKVASEEYVEEQKAVLTGLGALMAKIIEIMSGNPPKQHLNFLSRLEAEDGELAIMSEIFLFCLTLSKKKSYAKWFVYNMRTLFPTKTLEEKFVKPPPGILMADGAKAFEALQSLTLKKYPARPCLKETYGQLKEVIKNKDLVMEVVKIRMEEQKKQAAALALAPPTAEEAQSNGRRGS